VDDSYFFFYPSPVFLVPQLVFFWLQLRLIMCNPRPLSFFFSLPPLFCLKRVRFLRLLFFFGLWLRPSVVPFSVFDFWTIFPPVPLHYKVCYFQCRLLPVWNEFFFQGFFFAPPPFDSPNIDNPPAPRFNSLPVFRGFMSPSKHLVCVPFYQPPPKFLQPPGFFFSITVHGSFVPNGFFPPHKEAEDIVVSFDGLRERHQLRVPCAAFAEFPPLPLFGRCCSGGVHFSKFERRP